MNVPQTSKKEWLFLGLLSFVFALLWFGPLYTATAEQTSGVISIIREMFLNESSPELMIGKGVDLIGSFWMVEQVKQMLIHGQDTTLPWMYYPIGFDLGENTGYAWADASLAVPLSLLFGKLGFWNIHVLFVCSLSLFGLMVLFRQLILRANRTF